MPLSEAWLPAVCYRCDLLLQVWLPRRLARLYFAARTVLMQCRRHLPSFSYRGGTPSISGPVTAWYDTGGARDHQLCRDCQRQITVPAACARIGISLNENPFADLLKIRYVCVLPPVVPAVAWRMMRPSACSFLSISFGIFV